MIWKMAFGISVLLTWISLNELVLTTVFAATESYYTAAVFEFTQTKECVDTQEEANAIVKHNLDIFVIAAKHAKELDADIIIFPEYGIFPECFTREATRLFLEDIPDPKKERVNPCEDYERYSDRPQLLTLSCIAKNNSMVVQGNSGDFRDCKGEPGCPENGVFQFNANLVFDRDGTMLLRYHKEHLFHEITMDIAREKQVPVYKTDFGTFVSYVCFDLVLERTLEIARRYDADGITFSTMWESAMPMFITVQFFEAFSIGTNLTVMAADIQLPGQWATGSGIFNGYDGPLVYTYDADGLSKLLVARVPKRGQRLEEPKTAICALYPNGTFFDWVQDGKFIPFEGSENILPLPEDDFTTLRYHVADLKNYTLVKLTEPSGHVEACHEGLCCSLDYSAENLTREFHLAVFNGSQESFPPYYWCEEECMLVRCDPVLGKPCAAFPMRSKDRFHYAHFQANFSGPFVYPSAVNDRFRLAGRDKWNFYLDMQSDHSYKGTLQFESVPGDNLIVIGMKARCYERDPPFSFY